MPKFAVILPAAGKSSRFGDKEKKPYMNPRRSGRLAPRRRTVVARDDVCQTLLIIAPDDQEMFERRYPARTSSS